MTKKQKMYARLYMCENCPRDFSICYRNPSKRKLEVVEAIKKRMFYEGGYDLRFLTYSTCYFTCAYMVDENMLHVFTPSGSFYIGRTDF